jgi:hypothetical protein
MRPNGGAAPLLRHLLNVGWSTLKTRVKLHSREGRKTKMAAKRKAKAKGKAKKKAKKKGKK